MNITDWEFNEMRRYISGVTGLSLGDDKQYLVVQRLEPLVRDCGCADFSCFLHVLNRERGEILRDRVIAAITTNETSFFRDGHPFDTFRGEILPELIQRARERQAKTYARRGPKVRIWSAAASTGQEPYSLAMIIADAVQNLHPADLSIEDFAILASDISVDALSRAIAGTYQEMEIVRGLSLSNRERFFFPENGQWIIKKDIQRMVEFRRINLTEPFLFAGGFDVIFCRNVLIYFSTETRIRILEQFHQLLNDDGFLVLGSSENTYGVSQKFISRHYGKSIVYRKEAYKEG